VSFLSPLFLLGLLAVALPLALHLLRRRVTRTVPFPALRFLAATRANQRHQKLRRRVVLALRCLALAALAAAFARPFFGTPPATTTRATVVVIDNSFSLQAPERWQTLHREIRATLGSPGNDESLGLLLMNPRPTWLAAPTRDTSAALAAFDSLRPGWHATRAEPALRLAADVLAATPARERRLLFLGDHQALGWTGADFAKQLPPGVTAFFPRPAPSPSRQAAITAAAIAREGDASLVTATVRNLSNTRQVRTLSVFANGADAPVLTAPLALPVGESDSVRLALPAGLAPSFLRLSLDPDDLPADDTFWLVPPSNRAARLLLLDPPASATPADYLATAYSALAAVPPALRVAPPPATPWPPDAVAILRSDASFTPERATRLDAFLAAGGSALVFLDGGPAQAAWLTRHGLASTPETPRSGSARLRDWSLDHPLVAPLADSNLRTLVDWEFARAWSLPADAVEPLAFWTDGSVALGEARVGPGRVLLAGFTPDRRDGDWPVHPAFVPFLHRAATHLLGLSASTADAPLRVGAPLPATDSASAFWQPHAGPASDISNLKSQISNFFPAPGIYAAGSRLVAVNLDPAESDLAPWPEGAPWNDLVSTEPLPPTPPDAIHSALAADTEQQNPLWWWTLVALAAFALAELTLANRTTR
jgi:hypothetical protein